ncbi:MAG: methylenetetrahydrofolate reductase [NAD(P)H] [Planctomycetaceae bacterium]|nr:methylenetetrahydrofolate reductase [NAD(P)H] [Planctomycetaceae bacterium]
MRISEIYQSGDFGLSIEIFPPQTSQGDEALRETLKRLAVYRPAFFSCTYGAGGSTQSRTMDWCVEIQESFDTPATSHFTCVGSTREELLDWLAKAESKGIQNIMALRGDPPRGETTFQAVEGGLQYANELVSLIRDEFPNMGIGVAGYPEKHQECIDAHTDLMNLKRKVEAGADAVFTQLFYENANFFRFRESYQEAGIQVPLIPGIMPITEFARIKRITAMCGAVFPEELASRLEAVQDDKQAQYQIGVEHAIKQCEELIAQGVPGIHFYVLNKSKACEEILGALNKEPSTAESV